MKVSAKHKDIEAFIKTVRESFQDAWIIYTHGACYGFYRILKHSFPGAQPYCSEEWDHIITKIGDKFYDIHGECIDTDLKKTYIDKKAMSKRQKERWGALDGQRVEHMLAKYKKSKE